MKLSKTSLFSFIGILTLCATPMFGQLQASDSEAEATANSYNEECKYSAAFNDPEVMAQTMANPAKMMELFALMGNPQTAQMVMNCSTDPKTWTAWTTNYSNPTKLMNAFAAFMNPQLYMNWMTASMNPQTYQPAFGFMNPGIYMQWMTAAANPAFYQPMYKMADPKWQQESTAWMTNPNSFQKMFESMVQFPVVADATVTQ